MEPDVKHLAADVCETSARTVKRFKTSVASHFESYRNFTAAALVIVFVIYAWITLKSSRISTTFFGALLGCLIAFNAWLQYDTSLGRGNENNSGSID